MELVGFRKIFIVLFCFFMLISCAKQGAWYKEVHWDEFDFQSLPTATDYPEDPAVILLDEGEVEVFGSGEVKFSTFERRRIIKIFDSRAHNFANVVVPYTTQSQIKLIRARTISADGNITVLKKNDIFDVNLYPNFIFYSDQRAKIFTLPAVEDGAVLEYEYHITLSNHTFGSIWSFQDEVPILLSRFN
jgi:hypothetical protein